MSEFEELISEVYPDKPTFGDPRPTIGQVIGFLSAARIIESACISPQTNEFIEACRVVEMRLRDELSPSENAHD